MDANSVSRNALLLSFSNWRYNEEMMSQLRFWVLVFLLIGGRSVYGQTSRLQDFYNLNESRINKFQTSHQGQNISDDFWEVFAKNRTAIADSFIPLERKVAYQTRLIRFLETANSADLFAKGRYTEILRYNLFLIKWTERKQLAQNILQYPLISIRSLSLFADEPDAKLLLDSFATVYPEEVFRQAEAFADKPYATDVISKLTYLAPESVRRYFTTTGKLSGLLLRSNDPAIVTLRKIYNAGAIRAGVYYLFDPIFNDKMTVLQADSVIADKATMFSLLTQLMSNKDVAGKYSINKELEYIAVEVTRGLAMKKGGNTMSYSQIASYSKEQLFTLLVFGHKELFSLDVQYIENILLRNTKPISPYFIENLPKDAVSDLVRKMQEEEKLERLLQMAGSANREYLIAMFSYERFNGERQPKEERPQIVQPKVELPLAENHSAQGEREKEKETKTEEAVVPPIKPTTINSLTSQSKPVLANSEKNIGVKPVMEPVELEEIVEPIHFQFTDEELKIMRLKQNISKALDEVPSFLNEAYAKDILLYAADQVPDEVMQKSDAFKSKFFVTQILERAALNAPVTAKKYFTNPRHMVSYMLVKSQNPYIKKMFEINDTTKFRTKPYLLINEMVDENMSIGDVLRISNDEQLLFKELVRLVARKKYVGKFSIEKEFTYYALRFVRSINDKIGQADNIRFESLNNFTNDELYFLTVYGREEVFTSTFGGIFNRYEASLSADEAGFRHFLNLPKWRTFIAICAENNKLSQLLSHFSPAQREELLRQFVANLDTEEDGFDETIMVSETIANIDDEDILLPMQRNIKQIYQRCDSAKNNRCMATYGILASLCKGKIVTEVKWFRTMAKKYQAAEITTLRFKTVDTRNIVVEQMYFYDDADGHDSYQSFVNWFRSSPNWRIEEYFNYVKVSSVIGKRIEIYANKPSYEASGSQTIQKLFAENNYAPSVIIHRGHSFHTEGTLERVPESAKFVFIGSCGGFYKAPIAMRNAPGAHIIATRQIGSKQINDPLIFAINESFREGKDIEWPLFWDKMKASLGSSALFGDYVPPHKNIESLFQHAYYKTLGL